MSSIVLFPNSILREKSSLIDFNTDNIKKIVDDMSKAISKAGGIGLAAVQIGILKRIFIVRLEEQNNLSVFINPEIIQFSEEKTEYREGCLSIPDIFANTDIRSKNIKIRYCDIDNNVQISEASDLLSICIQHEMDHLNGVLFIDYLSQIKKERLLNKYFKNLEKKLNREITIEAI